MLEIAKIQKLFASFFADGQAVGAAFELPSPGTDELAVGIEDDHRVQAVAVRVNRVMDVNVALRILADTVRVAVFDGARHLAPVMDGLVLILALSKDGRLRASLVRRTQECGSAGCCCRANHKTASREMHDRRLPV